MVAGNFLFIARSSVFQRCIATCRITDFPTDRTKLLSAPLPPSLSPSIAGDKRNPLLAFSPLFNQIFRLVVTARLASGIARVIRQLSSLAIKSTTARHRANTGNTKTCLTTVVRLYYAEVTSLRSIVSAVRSFPYSRNPRADAGRKLGPAEIAGKSAEIATNKTRLVSHPRRMHASDELPLRNSRRHGRASVPFLLAFRATIVISS